MSEIWISSGFFDGTLILDHGVQGCRSKTVSSIFFDTFAQTSGILVSPRFDFMNEASLPRSWQFRKLCLKRNWNVWGSKGGKKCHRVWSMSALEGNVETEMKACSRFTVWSLSFLQFLLNVKNFCLCFIADKNVSSSPSSRNGSNN